METTGTIKHIFDLQKINNKFRKRYFVVTLDENKEPFTFIVVQKMTEILDRLNVGDNVKINFCIRGREFLHRGETIAKYFNSFQAWRIEKI